MNETLLSVRDLKVRFDTDEGEVKAVDGVSFDVMRGEVFAIVGESGSGKSVTAMSMLGLIPNARIAGGEAWWKETDLLQANESVMRRIRGGEIAMIFQDPLTALNPVHKIGRQIGEMVRIHRDASKKQARERAIELLDLVGIPQPERRVDNYPHEFSGGMRQRAMIAMAIACEPDLLIADEPTTALDVTVQAQVMEVLMEIKDRIRSSIILITHDLGLVAGSADRVMVMYAGRPVEKGSIDDLFYDTRHPYTLGPARLAAARRRHRYRTTRPDQGCAAVTDLGAARVPVPPALRVRAAARTVRDRRARVPVGRQRTGPRFGVPLRRRPRARGRRRSARRGDVRMTAVAADNGAQTEPELCVATDLVKEFPISSGLHGPHDRQGARGLGREPARRGRRDARLGGGVRLRQVDHRTTASQPHPPHLRCRASSKGKDISHLKEKELRDARQRFQIVFQDPYASLNPRMTIGRALAEPLARAPQDEQDRRAREGRRPPEERRPLARARVRAIRTSSPAASANAPASHARSRSTPAHRPRRARLRARRVDPGRRREPARAPAGRARPRLRLHRARPLASSATSRIVSR